MTAWHERDILRFLHLVLSIPIVGYLYGPVEHIARAASLRAGLRCRPFS
jgi:hypothetical protein